jgi:hypothetical protein
VSREAVLAAPSNPRTRPRTIKLLLDEKLHPEQPSKAHNVPKPIWTGEEIGRSAQEHKEHDRRTGHAQETVEFVAQLLHRAMIRGPAPPRKELFGVWIGVWMKGIFRGPLVTAFRIIIRTELAPAASQSSPQYKFDRDTQFAM